MPVGIIDLLQIVDVTEEQQRFLRIPTGQFQLLRRRSQKATPVIETRQIVGEGQRAQFPLYQRLSNSARDRELERVAKLLTFWSVRL